MIMVGTESDIGYLRVKALVWHGMALDIASYDTIFERI